MDKGSATTTSAEELLAEREQTLIEQQKSLEQQQQRLDETFQDLVAVTLQLQQLQRTKDTLHEQLQEKNQALNVAEARVGTLVGQLEEHETAAAQAEHRYSQALQQVEQDYTLTLQSLRATLEEERHTRDQQALEGVVQRQSQDLGRLVGLLEQQEVERDHRRLDGLVKQQEAERDYRRLLNLLERQQAAQEQRPTPGQELAAMLRRPFVGLYRKVFKRGKQVARTDRNVALIENSPWFDTRWYLDAYPDVAADRKGSQAPARHYLLIGAFEGRNPGPDFDSAFYIANNDDVRESGVNPLLHFIRFGEHEQRQPKAVS